MSSVSCLPIAAPAVASRASAALSSRRAILYSGVAVAGLVTVSPSLLDLWNLWTQDALKSVGSIVPLVSFVLILRAWRSIGWRARPNWWGLVIVLATSVVSWIQLHAILLLVLSPRWTTVLPPPSLPLLLYGAGAVLLLGGSCLFRAALFPIGLLWFANPVPHAFSLWVDLPLQALSARMARGFAIHLGYALTPDHLRLMFTPEFGMFIAPGCNGIRGSITMGLIALVAGHVCRLRWHARVSLVTGAVLLGYLFNLLRLCLLVLYYIVALHLPWLQNRAEAADYAIGAALFLCASFLLFSLVHRLRDSRPSQAPIPIPVDSAHRAGFAPAIALTLTACMAGAAFASSGRSGPALIRPAAERFPQTLGSYTLVRTWQETFDTGGAAYQWAEYAAAAGSPLAIGISPSMTWHDPLVCHSVRGEHPLWQGPLDLPTAALPVAFNSAFYSDGVVRIFEASTQCAGGNCNEFATARTHFGLVYSALDGTSLVRHPARSLPVVVRAETLVSSLPPEVSRRQLARSIQSLVASADLADLTRP